jgi:hypothetical protein
MGMEHPVAPKKLGVGNRAPSWNPDKHVKVIGEQIVGYDLYPAKISSLPKQLSKDFLCCVIEEPLEVYRPGHTMIGGFALLR